MGTLVKILRPDLYTPDDIKPATLFSAGLDLRLAATPKGSMELAREGHGWPYHDLVGTGLAVAIPSGYVGLLLPRSSAGHKRGLRLGNTAGVIDPDYRGELMLSIPASCNFDLQEGDCVGQLIVVAASAAFTVVDELPETARGAGGFGSTDKPCAGPWCPGCKQCGAAPSDPPAVVEYACPYCPWVGDTEQMEVDERGNLVCPDCLAILKEKNNG